MNEKNHFLRRRLKDCEMAPWEKALTTRSDDLNLIPETHVVETKK